MTALAEVSSRPPTKRPQRPLYGVANQRPQAGERFPAQSSEIAKIATFADLPKVALHDPGQKSPIFPDYPRPCVRKNHKNRNFYPFSPTAKNRKNPPRKRRRKANKSQKIARFSGGKNLRFFLIFNPAQDFLEIQISRSSEKLWLILAFCQD